ncbi:TetR family transcriptional regulator C-terminal domain-containing protein [Salipiger sp. 1_MG-2023]|uniref:TetR family transcriptional regulator C-terminal domain-containing protein n=1 Tax=Salipiger sp. 1_MG-2023 TaxID=3062665 RepID=UPI0026E25960|nr:TetR family transcriptional regulator C-terminal domain-containing protein [Salipiger sp. 1_MG-2023]MDO6585220.1 TetR family transcriptional regulator C-terminal domain-containing protein [Salipiger sp. 1_MG-2023]
MTDQPPPSKSRRAFVREAPETRRAALIQAALELIGEAGYRGATTRAIAERAGVTLGLIRHHFHSKEDLISAAYDAHMSAMSDLSLAPAERKDLPPDQRLALVIEANLTPPVMSERNVTLWASFIAQIPNEPGIRTTHDRTYLSFRDRLEALIAETLSAQGRAVPADELRRLATSCNALIDGLWLEGGACPTGLAGDDLVAMGQDRIGVLLGVTLNRF